jgi:hypothetical protein
MTPITSSVARSEELRLRTDHVRMIGGEDEGEDDRRQDEEEVGQAHQDVVDLPADEPGDDPDQRPDDDRDDRRHQADDHRDASPVNGQVQEVAPELVGAEGIGRARWLQRLAGRRQDALERPDEERREERQQAEEREDHQPDEPVRAPEETRGEVACPPARAGPPPGAELRPGEALDAHTRTRGSR